MWISITLYMCLIYVLYVTLYELYMGPPLQEVCIWVPLNKKG
jgi:hypothetical protein